MLIIILNTYQQCPLPLRICVNFFALSFGRDVKPFIVKCTSKNPVHLSLRYLNNNPILIDFQTNAKMALRKFIPHCSGIVLNLTSSEDVQLEEDLDGQLLFNLQILSEVATKIFILIYHILIFLWKTRHVSSIILPCTYY